MRQLAYSPGWGIAPGGSHPGSAVMELAEIYAGLDDSLRAVMPVSGGVYQPVMGPRPEPPHGSGTSVDLGEIDVPVLYPLAITGQVITTCERGHLRNRWTTYYYRGRAHCRLCRNLRRRERYRLTHTKWRTARELTG